MTQPREDLIQSIADELREGKKVVGDNHSYAIIEVYEYICGHCKFDAVLTTININASLNPQDAQGTQYKLDKMFDEAAYEYAESIADDVEAYRKSVSLDGLEGGY